MQFSPYFFYSIYSQTPAFSRKILILLNFPKGSAIMASMRVIPFNISHSLGFPHIRERSKFKRAILEPNIVVSFFESVVTVVNNIIHKCEFA